MGRRNTALAAWAVALTALTLPIAGTRLFSQNAMPGGGFGVPFGETQKGAIPDPPLSWDNQQEPFQLAIANNNVMEDRAIALLARDDFDQHHPEAFACIEFLKRIHSVKAVNVLSDRLLLHTETMNIPPREEEYPAFGALEEIGQPAVDALLRKIASTSTSNNYRALAMELMVKMLTGAKQTQRMIDLAISAAAPAEKERLVEFKKQFEHDWDNALMKGPIEFTRYDADYAVLPQFEPKAARSVVIARSADEFSKVFIAKAGGVPLLSKDFFEKNVILAVIIRNKQVDYSAIKVIRDGSDLTLHYESKPHAATPDASPTPPLIIAIPKGSFKKILFDENSVNAGDLMVNPDDKPLPAVPTSPQPSTLPGWP